MAFGVGSPFWGEQGRGDGGLAVWGFLRLLELGSLGGGQCTCLAPQKEWLCLGP